MTRRHLGIGGAVLVLCVAAVIAATHIFGNPEVRFTEAQIQRTLAERIPITRHDVTISEATVVVGDAEMVVSFTMTGRRFGQLYSLAGTAEGTIVYRSGEFFFKP